jgi:hypothetical protein
MALAFLATACTYAETGSADDGKQRQAQNEQDSQLRNGVVAIPLDRIWAFRMPGTRDIQKLNPSDKDLVELVQQSLGRKSSNGDAKSGFVVQGEAKDALQQAYDVLVSEKLDLKDVEGRKRIWIVFFSRDSSQYVHLHSIQLQANHITVRYRFVPHDSKELSRHFALIPLGNLPAGKYSVSMVNSPMEKRYLDIGFQPMPEAYVPKIVCSSFEFTVVENPDD